MIKLAVFHSSKQDVTSQQPGEQLTVKRTRKSSGAAPPSRKSLLTKDATKAVDKAANRKFARPGAERTNATLTTPINLHRRQQRLLPLQPLQRQQLPPQRPKYRQKNQRVE